MEELTDLWIEAEHWEPGAWQLEDDVTDVVATLSDGTRWIGTFCTFNHLAALRANCKDSGECLGGKYLWASDLILIDSTARESIEMVVRDLIATEELQSALSPVEEMEFDEDAD